MPNLVEITIKADDETAGGFASVLARYYALKNAMKDITIDTDPGAVTASIIGIKQKVQSIGLADIADVNVQPGLLYQRLYYIKRAMQQVGLGDIFGIGGSGKLPVVGPVMPYSFGQGPIAAIGGGGEGGGGGGSGVGGTIAAGGEGGGGSAIGAALGGMIGGMAGLSVGFGWLTKIGGVAGWHIVTDLVIEGLISIGTAAIAAAAGLAVMGPTMGNINDHLQAVNSVSKALGQNIPPISGKFQALAKAMAPQTIELYGAGINIVNTALNRMGPGASNVVNLFDTWAAKTVNWIQTQNTFGQIMKTGTGYLSQFGTLLGTLGQALGNLLTKDPGIARYLIDILQGVALLIRGFSDLPAPIVEATLAIHGLYLWVRVLGGLLGGFLGYLARMTTSFIAWAGSIYAIPVVLAAIAAAIAILAIQMENNGTPAIHNFVSQWQQLLGNEKASQFIYGNVAALGAMDAKLKQVNQTFEANQLLNQSWFQQGITGFAALGTYFGRWAKNLFTFHWPTALKDMRAFFDIAGSALNNGQSSVGPIANIMRQDDVNRLNKMIDQVIGSERSLFHETGNLILQGYTFQQSLGLMDLAGVKQSDSFVVMRAKVDNLIQGYKDMSVTGGVLANSVNAVTFQVMLQDSHVQNLMDGWSSFFGVVTSGLNSYLGVAAALNTLQAGLQQGGGLTGTDQQSVTNQQNAMAAIAAIQQEQNAMLQQLATANLGKKGTDMLTSATKDYLQAILQVTGTSNSEFLPALNAIAQQGGLPAAASMGALAAELGPKLQNPMGQAAGITNTLDTKVQNLNTDVQNLSVALGTTLTNAMHQAIFLAAGGQKPFTNFAGAVMNAHGNLGLMQGSANTLIGTLIRLDPTHAKKLFEDFAGMLGLTKDQADSLWSKSLPKLQSVIDSLHGKTVDIVVNTLYTQPQGSSQMGNKPLGFGGISAAAVGGPRSGLTVVGEYGRELVQLPSGSHVMPHSNVAAQNQAFGMGGMGGWSIQASVAPGTGNAFERLLLQVIRLLVLKNGGGGTNSVQKAFGQTH